MMDDWLLWSVCRKARITRMLRYDRYRRKESSTTQDFHSDKQVTIKIRLDKCLSILRPFTLYIRQAQ